MSKIDDGGPANPCFVPDGTIREEVDIDAREVSFHPVGKHVPGMSLRDWFAGQALAGLCANPMQTDLFANVPKHEVDNDDGIFEDIAASCYDLADAMIAARKDGGGE